MGRSLALAVSLICALAVGAAAQGTVDPPPADTPPAEPRVDTPEPAPEPAGGLSDEELARLAEEDAQVIEVWDERPEKPHDRDTDLRLTGAELAERGATDLATALALIHDVTVRDVGRGGQNLDIRGGRRGAVRVLIDGVAVSDPFYGTFDVSSIPITDIEQIRVSTAPGSPIDGPGGPAGVIEVHTRDAVGARLVVARLTGDTLPTFGASATGRTAFSERLALRLSASSVHGMHEYETVMDDVTVDDRRRSVTGAMRLEYRHRGRRAVLDGFVDDRRYVVPPADEGSSSALILLVDRETTGRLGAGFDADVGADKKLQVQGRAWLHAMHRMSRNFRDFALTDQANAEDLSALRVGGNALATRPVGRRARWIAAVTVDHERATVEADRGASGVETTRGDATVIEAAAGGQVEIGSIVADVAGGIAVPIGVGADPWPEAKATVKARPITPLEIEVIGARKGRVPSLRERYQGSTSNVALAPEMAWHGELRVVVRPIEHVELEAAPYYRHTTGTVKLDPGGSGMLVNLGELKVRGVDTRARARVHRVLEVGASYSYAHADSADLGPDPLDRFPRHRADGWGRVTPTAMLAALVRARYAGRGIDLGVTTPAYVVWEASVTANLRGDWLGVLRCDDLLDQRPETRAGYHTQGRVISLALQGTWD